MNPSRTACTPPCAAITSSAWKRSAASPSTRPGRESRPPSRQTAAPRKGHDSFPIEKSMIRNIRLPVFALCWLPAGASAADLRVLPGEMDLTGPHAAQRLLVLSETGGRVDGDLTEKARFMSSNPAVAKVDADGTVRAV